MQVVAKGQMFYGGKPQPGPLFEIYGTHSCEPYKAVVRSHYPGNESQILNERDGFATVGEAMEWVFDHQQW